MPDAPLSREGRFRLDAPVARVVPLFTPAGERAWAPGWDPVMLSGDAARGSAFRTVNGEGVESVWIVTAHDPAQGRASYARIAQGSNVGLVDVACTAAGDAATDVAVRYTLTGLDAAGDAFVREFLAPERYAAFMETWRTLISQALASGAGTQA